MVVPERVTTSVPTTPLKVGVPVNEAAVVLSYTLFDPVKPVTVNEAVVIFPVNPLGCVKV